jgi:hypothetical protein
VTKKWIAINLALLLAAGLLGWQLKVAIESFKAENNIAKIQPAKKKTGSENVRTPAQPPQKYNEAQFSSIYNQDLFAQSRKLEDQAAASPQPETKTLQNPPILVGAVIAGSKKTALIIDPSQSGIHSTQTMRVGDMYQGFTVTDITGQNIVLEYGASREIIPLSDTSKPAQRGKTPILQTRIVSFGAQAGGGQGANAGGMAAFSGANSRTGAAQNPAAGRGNPQQVVPMQQPVVSRGVNQPAQPAAAPAGQGNLFPNQYINSQNQLITITPFGEMVSQPAPPTQAQQPVKK